MISKAPTSLNHQMVEFIKMIWFMYVKTISSTYTAETTLAISSEIATLKHNCDIRLKSAKVAIRNHSRKVFGSTHISKAVVNIANIAIATENKLKLTDSTSTPRRDLKMTAAMAHVTPEPVASMIPTSLSWLYSVLPPNMEGG